MAGSSVARPSQAARAGRPSRQADRTEETLGEVLRGYEREGFTGQFSARPAGRVLCAACRRESDAVRMPIKALHRLEGVSDPGEEMAVAAVECPNCHVRGTLALTYGPGASAEDGQVLRRLPDDRGHGIRPGI